MSWNLKIAYELFEVRTGDDGLKPVYRLGHAPTGTISAIQQEARDVFGKAFGEDGDVKRVNVLALKKAFDSSWEEGGASRRELEAFMKSIA